MYRVNAGVIVRAGVFCLAAMLVALPAAPGLQAQGVELSGRAKASDRNGDGVIDREEAGGPLMDNFDAIDCDRSGTLDGAEIRGFFTGEGCPAAAAPSSPAAIPASLPVTASPAAPPAAPPAASPAGGGENARAVRVDKVVREPQSQTYPVIGRLVALRAGDVAARINGAVADLKVTVGSRVEKDDVIAEIQDDRLATERDKYAAALRNRQAMLLNAQAELQKKSQELKRMADLRESSAFSRARFEDLESDVAVRRASIAERESAVREAEAELKRADIDFHNTRIRAPYDGIVSETHTEIGAYVSVGAAVVSMINDRDLEIEAEVPTDRVAGLAAGRTVRFRLDDGTVHLAEVRSIVPLENVRTRTRPVRFTPTFGDTAKPLAANQSVTVDVPVGKIGDVVTVHKDAVVYRGPDTVVYAVRNGRAFPVKAKLGGAVGSRFIVLSGLEAGDTVVTHGNETLPPGAAIRLFEGDAKAESKAGSRAGNAE